MNVASLVDAHRGSRRALCGSEGWFDWSAVRRLAGEVAAGLSETGVRPGDRVAIAWPTSTEFVVAYLGVLATGAVAVPLNPSSPVGELERELGVVDPAVVVCGDRDRGRGPSEVSSGVAAKMAEIVSSETASPRLIAPERSSSRVSRAWEDLFRSGTGASQAADRLAAAPREDSDAAVMLFTSGTSGSSKPAVLSHGNLISNLRQMLAGPGNVLGPDDVGLGAVPFFHVLGLNVVLGLSLATGAALVCEERFDPGESMRLIAERAVSVVAGAPAMFTDWAEPDTDAVTEGDPFETVRLFVSGASALPEVTASRFEERYGHSIWEGYGLTEASPAVATSVGLAAPRRGSVGRPLPGVEVRLVDESGDDVLSDDPGEIWVRGPNVFGGYWRDEASTSEVLGPGGWLHTGDVGVLDGAGELHVVDRLKDIIIVSGFNVVPGEVERVIEDVEGVREAVVLGSPDGRTGESVEAVVVREPGSEVSASAITAAARRHLAPYKVPASVRFVESLPRGLTGKALRRAAREAT